MSYDSKTANNIQKYEDAGFTIEQAVLLAELENKIAMAAMGFGGLMS